MNKKWLSSLALDVEGRHGKEAMDKIFGDFRNVPNDRAAVKEWFNNFTCRMDELGDKDFLQQMMANHCPCGGGDAKNGKAMREFYDNSKTLEEFVDSFRAWLHKKYRGDIDNMELNGNVLYMTKPLKKNRIAGILGKGCHCALAKHTDNAISNIFCHCCTIGHTGKMFKAAFGDDIKMEFIESVICGGKGCTMAIYLPEMKGD